MIVPYEKHDDMTNLDIETLHEIMALSKESMKILKLMFFKVFIFQKNSLFS